MHETTRSWEHLSEEFRGSRALLLDRLVVSQDEDDDLEEADSSELPGGHDYAHRRLYPMWVCSACGGLQEENTEACAATSRASLPAASLPPSVPTFFTPGGEVLPQVLGVSELGAVIQEHRVTVMAALRSSFTQAWPEEDLAAVAPLLLEQVVEEVVPSSMRSSGVSLRPHAGRLWAAGAPGPAMGGCRPVRSRSRPELPQRLRGVLRRLPASKAGSAF